MNKNLGLIVSVLSAIAFGLYPAATQKAYAQGANPSYLIVSTTLLRALFLYLLCISQSKSLALKKENRKQILMAGFFQSLSIFGILGSVVYLPGAVTIVITFTHTIMLLLFTSYKRGEKLSPLAIGVSLATLFGVGLVVDVWSFEGSMHPVGLSLAGLSAIATTARLYLFESQLKKTDASVVGAQIFFVTLIFTLMLWFFIPPHLPQSIAGHIWVMLASASLVLGTVGMFYGIKLIGGFEFSLYTNLEPIFTAFFSFLLLGEILSLHTYLGLLIVVASLVFYKLTSRKV